MCVCVYCGRGNPWPCSSSFRIIHYTFFTFSRFTFKCSTLHKFCLHFLFVVIFFFVFHFLFVLVIMYIYIYNYFLKHYLISPVFLFCFLYFKMLNVAVVGLVYFCFCFTPFHLQIFVILNFKLNRLLEFLLRLLLRLVFVFCGSSTNSQMMLSIIVVVLLFNGAISTVSRARTLNVLQRERKIQIKIFLLLLRQECGTHLFTVGCMLLQLGN